MADRRIIPRRNDLVAVRAEGGVANEPASVGANQEMVGAETGIRIGIQLMDGLPIVHAPDPRRAIDGARHNPAAPGIESKGADARIVAVEAQGQLFQGGPAPPADGLVGGGGDDFFAVGKEVGVMDLAGMTAEERHANALLSIPDPNLLVGAHRQHPPGDWPELDLGDVTRMGPKLPQKPARSGVPDPYGTIAASGCGLQSIPGEGDTFDRLSVAGETVKQAAVVGIPKCRVARVDPSRDQNPSVGAECCDRTCRFEGPGCGVGELPLLHSAAGNGLEMEDFLGRPYREEPAERFRVHAHVPEGSAVGHRTQNPGHQVPGGHERAVGFGMEFNGPNLDVEGRPDGR
jgi:hypothetical protein